MRKTYIKDYHYSIFLSKFIQVERLFFKMQTTDGS